MEVHELKSKWGKYCDTDKLVREMALWFNANGIRNSPKGICSMLDTFFTNKEEIIKMFEKSDNYVGDMRILIDTTMCRYSNRNEVFNFVNRFPNNVDSRKAILKTVDENGKKLNDYICIGKKTVSVEDLVSGNIGKAEFSKWQKIFEDDGYTINSVKEYSNFHYIMDEMCNVCGPVISETAVNAINKYNSSIKAAKGTKTARVFNKVCTTYGVDKLPKYNKLFAEYADMVSESKRNIKFYISVNPLDYLTMSVGRSWKSCHAPRHGYFAGTVSYMLDEVSIITFVHDTIPEDIVGQGKVYRNMFFYKDGVLVQSRVYPQANDGCTNLYDEFRDIVQKELAQDIGAQNNWTKCSVHMNSKGRQYPDYIYGNNAKTYYVGSKQGATSMNIGHKNICPYCGELADFGSGTICHSNCSL